MKETKPIHRSIIASCKNNNAKAQMQLYDLYCDAMFRIVLRYVKDTFQAEDIMQEAFIKAFSKINTYKEEVAFGAWLKRIMINQSIDWLKKKKLAVVSLNEETTSIIDEGDWKISPSITYEQIIVSINALKEKYRLVLTLYLLEGYDHQEISEILGIPEVTSRTHLLRGKQQVQELLKSSNYG